MSNTEKAGKVTAQRQNLTQINIVHFFIGILDLISLMCLLAPLSCVTSAGSGIQLQQVHFREMNIKLAWLTSTGNDAAAGCLSLLCCLSPSLCTFSCAPRLRPETCEHRAWSPFLDKVVMLL